MGSSAPRQLRPPQNAESLMTPITTARPTPTLAPDPISPATAKATTPHPTPWKTHVPAWAPVPKPARHR
eukprot:7921664-Pyramimonas_sp.AAC.1